MTSGPWGRRVVIAWVHLYTADMPASAARQRREELRSDVHEQIAEGIAAGRRSWALSRALIARMLRGLPSDVAWRAEVEADASGRDVLMARPGVVITALGLLAVPFWLAAELWGKWGWSGDVHGPALGAARLLWVLSLSYGLVAAGAAVIRWAFRR